jgi:hypothetical protein
MNECVEHSHGSSHRDVGRDISWLPMPPTTPADVLSAMITPAVLISAAGLLSLSTSQRLARVVDRTRLVVHEFQSLSSRAAPGDRAAREAFIVRQLRALTSRARLVQWALTCLYISLALFIMTSLLLGLAVVLGGQSWIALGVGVTGALCLLASSLLLIGEARIAVRSLGEEIAFIRGISRETGSIG